MEFLLEISLVGLAVGGVYGLIGLGYVIVYRATRIVNFAHGNIMMFGAYCYFTGAAVLGLPWWAALPLAIVATALLGTIAERFLLRPLEGRSQTVALLATFGLASVLHGLAQLLWTTRNFFMPPIFPQEPIILGAMYIPANTGYGALLALFAVALFLVLFRVTNLGLAMRATASDQVAASSLGINVPAMFSVTWACAAATAALAGVVVGSITTLNPNLGRIGLSVLAVVILGGLDSLAGAILAGLIVGWLEAVTGFYLGASYKDVVPFLVLLTILMVRPHGLLGAPRVERL